MKGINLYLYEYVNNYFYKNFPESYILIPDTLVEYKIDNIGEIRNEYVKMFLMKIQSKYNIDDMKNGKVDEEFYTILDSFVNKYFTSSMRNDCSSLYSYVRNLLIKKGLGNKFSSDLFDHFVKSIVARAWSQFDESRFNVDTFDHVIGLIYDNIYSQYEKMINDRVDQLINYNFDIISNRNNKFDMVELKKFVNMMIFKREDRTFLSRLNKLKINPDVELSRTSLVLDSYVKQYIKFLNRPKENKQEVKTEYIKTDSIKVQPTKKKEVAQERVIKRDACLENIRVNSVVGEAVPDKIKVNRGSKKVEKNVIALCLLAIMTINTISMNNYVDRRIHEMNDNTAMQRVMIVDGFDYSKKLRNDEYYNKIADNIINVYSKLGQIEDENYKTLCLYDAYKGCSTINEMDKIFNILRSKIVLNDVELNLRNIVKADSKQTYFYLDFVYDRLSNMGYNEVNSQEYQDALLRWKYANYGNYYGAVGVYMSNSEKEIIKDVIKKYEEHCEKDKLNFGYLLGEGGFDLTSTYDSSSVKGHSL